MGKFEKCINLLQFTCERPILVSSDKNSMGVCAARHYLGYKTQTL